MSGIRFEWDRSKDNANLRKHGASFAEAQTVFYDENAIEFFDDVHSKEEERFLMLGLSSKFRILLVAYTYREKEGVIRLISARRATKNEAKEYKRSEG
jgi:hypothetical protein